MIKINKKIKDDKYLRIEGVLMMLRFDWGERRRFTPSVLFLLSLLIF
jgi:hypothetical protein